MCVSRRQCVTVRVCVWSGRQLSDLEAAPGAVPGGAAPQITAIVAYSKGFACSAGPGTVQLFEKSDDKEFFKKGRLIRVGGSDWRMCAVHSRQLLRNTTYRDSPIQKRNSIRRRTPLSQNK